MEPVFVGLDVHATFCAFIVQDAAGQVLGRGDVPTTTEGLQLLRDSQNLPPDTKVALETGTTAFYVARQLRAEGLLPVVVDAHEVRLKAHRPTQKSDRRDAAELCEGLRRGIYRCIVHVPDEAMGRLREMMSRRRHFVRIAAAEINAAKRLLRSIGTSRLAPRLNTLKEWNGLLSRLPEATGLRGHIERHRAVWECAREQVKSIEEELKHIQKPFEQELQRLQTIPGVGPVVAMTALAVFSDIERFPTAKHVASYVLSGVVASLQADVAAGYLDSLSDLLHGEVFADFLEMASHLSDEGYKDAAAVIAGGTLESHLRQLCQKAGVTVEQATASGMKPKKADLLNSDLASASAYTKLRRTSRRGWISGTRPRMGNTLSTRKNR